MGAIAGLAFCRCCHTLPHVAADRFIQCRVSAETKARLRACAQREQVTESALLKRLLDVTLNAGHVDVAASSAANRRHQTRRVSVRVRPDDAALLQARAAARHIPPGTYAAMVLRSHLQGVAPIPRAELEALRRTVGGLGALSRQLRTLAVSAPRGVSEPQADARSACFLILKVCEALRDHVHALLNANLRSWIGDHAR